MSYSFVFNFSVFLFSRYQKEPLEINFVGD